MHKNTVSGLCVRDGRHTRGSKDVGTAPITKADVQNTCRGHEVYDTVGRGARSLLTYTPIYTSEQKKKTNKKKKEGSA